MAMFQPLGRALGASAGTGAVSTIVALGVGGDLGKTSSGTYAVPVPPWAAQVDYYLWGASGGTGANRNSQGGGGTSGPGAYVSGTLPVTPGETLTVIVGGKGRAGNGSESGLGSGGIGGDNGGGTGGQRYDTGYGTGGGGGGATEIDRSTNRLAVAAGGGGCAAKGNTSYDASGGKAGAPNGSAGTGYYGTEGGYGATDTAAGAASAYGGTAGSGAVGGNGGNAGPAGGGGGGGGLFGGGGGGSSTSSGAGGDSGGGGGGSSKGQITASGSGTTAPMETSQYYVAPAARGVVQINGTAGVDGNDGRAVLVFRS